MWARLNESGVLTASTSTWALALSAALVHAVLGLAFGPYRVTHLRGSFEEIVAVTGTAAATAVVLTIIAVALPELLLPRSVALFGTALAIVLMFALRFLVRAARARRLAGLPRAEKVIVLGAGLAGRRLVHNLLADESADLTPVAFLDDDRGKRRLRVEGVPVRGTRHDIVAVAALTGARHLVVAIPRASPELLREVHEMCRGHLTVKVLPALNTWLRPADPQYNDLRDLNLADLLGRRPIALDQQAISDHLEGKVVVVTGAGGSIGSELCRQIRRFRPARLVMLDRDESALHATQLSLTGRALLHGEDLLLADIRDLPAVRGAFESIQPHVVFHAAALKHLSLLERYPHEAWKSNVLGTLNVLRAAADAGVDTFVNISTDKAASPSSVLGCSKRVAERLTSHFAMTQPGRYVSVRFGNVLGSRGSVVPAFTEQIRRGGPVTVTHPDVERYFMLIPEACQLVLQAATLGRDGEAMVLDMGTPVRIADVAKELIALSGRTVEIQYTGLRPGEKMSEVLFADLEQRLPVGHPLMTAVQVPLLAPHAVLQLDVDPDDDGIRDVLADLARTAEHDGLRDGTGRRPGREARR